MIRAWASDHFEVPLPAGHPFPMPKYRALRERLLAEGVVVPTLSEEAPVAWLNAAHDPQYVARALSDMFGICVSGGFHCAHVLHARTHLDGTVRASPHVFNTAADIDRLVEGVREIAS